MKRKNIMVFSLARGGTTLLSLLLGAHTDITNFGESHWIFKNFYSKDKSGGRVDNSCRAHGKSCPIINELSKNGISYKNHFKMLMSSAKTGYILTTNKHFGHYKVMDYKNFDNKVILMHKPFEMWAGSFIGKNKIALPKDKDKAIEKLLDMYCSFYLKNLKLIKNNKHLNDFMVVDYEKLVTEKDKYLKDICSFLDIEYEEGMMKFNSYLISGDINQHPIGGNVRTYFNINNGRDSRYSKDINSIYVESKYTKKFTESEIKNIKANKKYIAVKKKLGLL